jgi:hypothetical protein
VQQRAYARMLEAVREQFTVVLAEEGDAADEQPGDDPSP